MKNRVLQGLNNDQVNYLPTASRESDQEEPGMNRSPPTVLPGYSQELRFRGQKSYIQGGINTALDRPGV